jgi:hypothetical protein
LYGIFDRIREEVEVQERLAYYNSIKSATNASSGTTDTQQSFASASGSASTIPPAHLPHFPTVQESSKVNPAVPLTSSDKESDAPPSAAPQSSKNSSMTSSSNSSSNFNAEGKISFAEIALVSH